MTGKKSYSLILAAALLAAGWFAAPAASPAMVAGSGEALADSDGDFIPDVVEWAVLTSATNPDTDNDLIPDFVEVVQRGRPRAAGAPLPFDHEARVVVTAPRVGAPGPTWLHLMLRFAGATPNLNALEVWMEIPGYPGLKVPLSFLAVDQIVLRTRATANDGLWVYVAAPMVSETVLQQLLPCSIHARADFGGRVVTTGVKLFNVLGQTVSLVPYSEAGFAMQSIGVQSVSTSSYSNKVCLLELREAGSGPGGTVYEVTAAECEDCNELECSPSCSQSVGWVLTLPGGMQGMFGR